MAIPSTAEAYVKAGERFSDAQLDKLSQFSPGFKDDHAAILAVFRIAAGMPEDERQGYLRSQDVAQDEMRVAQDEIRRPKRPVVWTTEDLVAALDDQATLPAKLTSVTKLVAPDRDLFRPAMAQLFTLARTVEDAVQVADWVIRVSKGGQNGLPYLWASIYKSFDKLSPDLQPRPPPKAYLDFLAAHEARLSRSLSHDNHPLVVLVEIYTRLFIQDRRRLDPVAKSPPPTVVNEIECLRQQHLDAVRAIHTAIDGNEGHIHTQRSTGSLMWAYGHGQAFAQVHQIWAAARADGGTGVDPAGVSIVSPPLCTLLYHATSPDASDLAYPSFAPVL